jgi:acyl transferase domain-containing protein
MLAAFTLLTMKTNDHPEPIAIVGMGKSGNRIDH